MALYNNILERVKFIAGGKAELRNKPPIAKFNESRGLSTISSQSEIEASAYGTVFSCLQLRANGLVTAELTAYRELNWEKEELANSHWVNRLLSNPNPFFTYSQIFRAIQNWYDINGNAFVWTPKMGHDVPLQMWVLNPTRVRVIRGGDNFIKGYVYQSVNDGSFSIPEEEVVHLANIYPSATKPDELIGMNLFGKGIVHAALPYANIDMEVSQYLMRLFENNAVPPVIAKTTDTIDSEYWNSLKQQWNENLPNFQLKAVLEGGLELELPPVSQLSVSYDAVSRDVRAQIAQVFGVSSGLLTGEFTNRATAEVQYAVFRQQTIDPVAKYVAEEFTRHFRRFEDDLLIESAPYQFIDVDQQIKQEEFEIKYGIRTINDSRRERGYDTIVDGDAVLVGSGLIPLKSIFDMGEAPIVAPRQFTLPKTAITPRSFPTQTAEARAEHWRQYDNMAQSISREISGTVGMFVQEIEREVYAAVDNGGQISELGLTDTQRAKLEKQLADSSNKVVLKVLTDFGMGKEDLTGDFGRTLQETVKSVNNNIVSTVADSMDLIKQDVIETLSENATQPVEVLREILSREFNTLSTTRVAMIAQTTATSVTTAAQKSVFATMGVKSMWNTQRDAKVRGSHRAMDGQIQNELGWFKFPDGSYIDRPVGEAQGGTTVKAANVVRCRCYLFPIKDNKR
jgi:HK97 family phage portal protein